eukprot:3982487-Pyramimonas_sp.AAC.2
MLVTRAPYFAGNWIPPRHSPVPNAEYTAKDENKITCVSVCRARDASITLPPRARATRSRPLSRGPPSARDATLARTSLLFRTTRSHASRTNREVVSDGTTNLRVSRRLWMYGTSLDVSGCLWMYGTSLDVSGCL